MPLDAAREMAYFHFQWYCIWRWQITALSVLTNKKHEEQTEVLEPGLITLLNCELTDWGGETASTCCLRDKYVACSESPLGEPGMGLLQVPAPYPSSGTVPLSCALSNTPVPPDVHGIPVLSCHENTCLVGHHL